MEKNQDFNKLCKLGKGVYTTMVDCRRKDHRLEGASMVTLCCHWLPLATPLGFVTTGIPRLRGWR